jgi:hypothetical protein
MLTGTRHRQNQLDRLGFQGRRPLALLVVMALAAVGVPTIAHGQTLDWYPSASGGLSDGSGLWDAGTLDWFNIGSSQSTGWINGADAVIGGGSQLTSSPIITLDTAGPMVANSITFNAVGAGSSVGYTITDGSGTGANTLGVGGSNAMTITDNAAGVTTAINAPIVSNGSNPFTLNILGTGNLSLGKAIGVTTGANTGAGTLRIGSAPGTGYSGTVTLGAANNLSGITVNSGTVSTASAASLGSGTVTLAGGTLSFLIPGVQNGNPIAMHVAAAANTTNAHNTMTASMSAAGVVSVAAGNWNNLQVARGGTPEQGYPGNGTITANNQQSTLPFTLKDSSGTNTAAQVVNWWGSNTFAVTGSATNGTHQMFSSGFNANGSTASFGSNQSSFTLDHIPYANYNVYLYLWNNSAGAIGQAVLETGSGIRAQPSATSSPTGLGLAGMVAPTLDSAVTSYSTLYRVNERGRSCLQRR